MEEKERMLSQAVTARPLPFKVGGELLYLYPPTLGKIFLQQDILEKMAMNHVSVTRNMEIEMLRIVKEKKEECLTLIAYHTCKSQEEIFDAGLIEHRKELLSSNADDAEITTLLITVLTSDKTILLFQQLGIDKEQERLRRVMERKSKNDKNNITFGGLSLFGSLIDAACERYGWTKEYVVWGIDYTSLRLMMADKISSMFISDEERKKIPASLLSNSSRAVKGTKENMERIKAMGWH